MCTEHTNLLPQGSRSIYFYPMDTDGCAHRSCPDIEPYIHVHMFISIQKKHNFISHHFRTHICSMSYTKSSPNKNFIHCSQIQY